jgi:hypothetical protein
MPPIQTNFAGIEGIFRLSEAIRGSGDASSRLSHGGATCEEKSALQ